MIRSSLASLSLIVAVTLLGSACATAAAPSTPTKQPQSAATAPTPSAAKKDAGSAATPESKEVSLVKSVRPSLANTVAALEKGDIAAAKTAWAPYDGLWNGIEVYVSFRAQANYKELESTQGKITNALEQPKPNATEILPLARAMLAKYDESIGLSETGPAISPLFDDVADLRIARAPLRKVPSALKAGDLASAKASFNDFAKAWPNVAGLIKVRSAGLNQEIDQAIAQVNTAWQKPQPTAAELTPLVATVTDRFNYGVSLLTMAARKADLSKTAYSNEDVQTAAGIKAIQAELKTSLNSWNAGKYQDAADQAKRASGELFNAGNVATPLKAQALDAAFKTALDAYAAVAGAPGDAAKVNSANKAAIEAGEVALQGVVGQFWTDPKLQDAIAKASSK